MSVACWLCTRRERFQVRLLPVSLFVAALSVLSHGESVLARTAEPEQTTIRITTNLVVLPVSVTDAKGTFVAGLSKRNFHVFEDGKPQNVTLFVEEDAPVTVGLLVDHSRSMSRKLVDVSTAVSVFAHSSNPTDEMFVVDFSDHVSIGQFDGKPFTNDVKILEKAVLAVSARGQTALYDAVAEGLKHVELGTRDKKALVIVSDGGDNASHHKYSEVLNLTRRTHAVIYAIVLAGQAVEEEDPRALRKLCRDTGGMAFFPRAGQSISEIAKVIARDLREQYTLGYTPSNSSSRNSYRKLAVQVEATGYSGLRVRTRAGYLAPQTDARASRGNGGDG